MGMITDSTPNYDAALKSLGVPPGPVRAKRLVRLPHYATVWLLLCLLTVMVTKGRCYHEHGARSSFDRDASSQLLIIPYYFFRFYIRRSFDYAPLQCSLMQVSSSHEFHRDYLGDATPDELLERLCLRVGSHSEGPFHRSQRDCILPMAL